MSPKVRQILIDASKSANPVVVLTTELQKINSEEEQERLATEFRKFESDPAMQRCSDDVTKKYGIDENNKESQQKVLKAAAENKACEVTYALMKIGLQYEKLNPKGEAFYLYPSMSYDLIWLTYRPFSVWQPC
jgi:hypothetical protein